MLYIQHNQQLGRLGRCVVRTPGGLGQLTRVFYNKDGQLTSMAIQSPPLVGTDFHSYEGGTIVMGGRGVIFTQPGSHTLTLPAGISLVHMVAIGAGGSGGRGGAEGSGGGGGGLAAAVNVPVSGSLSITVGLGGAIQTGLGTGNAGGFSAVDSLVHASGGAGGEGFVAPGGAGGTGSGSAAGLVTGTGGAGGGGINSDADGGGGGGAGGYGAVGGRGGGSEGQPESGLHGSGSGGGAGGAEGYGGQGGGTGLFGRGANGIAPANTSDLAGINGGDGSVNPAYTYTAGGGGGGADDTGTAPLGGENGAVLICWGDPLPLL